MRCSCRSCGAYMVQTERGMFSGCQCPECFNICRDCMGTPAGPMSAEEIRRGFKPRDDKGDCGGERPEGECSDWRKYL